MVGSRGEVNDVPDLKKFWVCLTPPDAEHALVLDAVHDADDVQTLMSVITLMKFLT